MHRKNINRLIKMKTDNTEITTCANFHGKFSHVASRL